MWDLFDFIFNSSLAVFLLDDTMFCYPLSLSHVVHVLISNLSYILEWFSRTPTSSFCVLQCVIEIVKSIKTSNTRLFLCIQNVASA